MSVAIASPEDEGTDLVGSYYRFGDIGPVYQVVSYDGQGFMTICLVESGDTARYPIGEIRKDPVA